MRKLMMIADGNCLIGTYEREQEYASVYSAVRVVTKNSFAMGVRELRKLAIFGPHGSDVRLVPIKSIFNCKTTSVILSLDINEDVWSKLIGESNKGQVISLKGEVYE